MVGNVRHRNEAAQNNDSGAAIRMATSDSAEPIRGVLLCILRLAHGIPHRRARTEARSVQCVFLVLSIDPLHRHDTRDYREMVSGVLPQEGIDDMTKKGTGIRSRRLCRRHHR